MTTFNFPMHKVSTRYLPNGTTLQFGNAYAFTSKPDAPDQREFTLYFTGFKYFVNDDGTIDSTTNAAINNMAALEAFIVAHGIWNPFTYPHAIYGNITVLLKTPLEIPKGVVSGSGAVEDFQLVFVEQP